MLKNRGKTFRTFHPIPRSSSHVRTHRPGHRPAAPAPAPPKAEAHPSDHYGTSLRGFVPAVDDDAASITSAAHPAPTSQTLGF